MSNDLTLLLFRNLGIALAVGLLIGLERGWQQREAEEGQRVAGVRTLAIVGLAGGICGLLAQTLGPMVLGLALLALAGMLIAAHILSAREFDTYGITSEIATFTTFVLGALTTVGFPAAAAAGAVAVMVLLGLKPELHRWLTRLDHAEILAAFELLVITVIVLPLLPDRAMGPWNALNPFRLWVLIALVSAISFIGHFAVRLLGHTRGILLSGAFGGLASATALTVSFSHLTRRRPGLSGLLATGIVLALAVTFPRMLVVTWFVSRTLAASLLIPLAAMTAVCLAFGLFLHWRTSPAGKKGPRRLGPPFRIQETLRFGVLLIAITLISAAIHHYLGATGVYLVAAVGALANLTAVALSIAQLANRGLSADIATHALVIAAISGSVFKAVLAAWLGNRSLGVLIGIAALLAAVAGVVSLLWLGTIQ